MENQVESKAIQDFKREIGMRCTQKKWKEEGESINRSWLFGNLRSSLLVRFKLKEKNWSLIPILAASNLGNQSK